MIMSNHQSNLDPVLISWIVRRPLAIPGKVELFHIPVLGWILRHLGSFPVDRDAADSAALRHSLEMLRRKRLLLVFPEARRSRTGAVGPFRPTLTKVAIRKRIPVVPVGVAGTGRLLPPGKVMPAWGSGIAVLFGPPGDVTSGRWKDRSEAQPQEVTERIRLEVVRLAREAERAAGGQQ